jgi:hypothetical protein
MSIAEPPVALVLPPVRPVFRLLAQAICPDARQLDEPGWAALERRVEGAVAQRPAAMRRQFVLFIRILAWLPVLTTGRAFELLPAASQVGFLHRVERSPFAMLRRGMWGLRTLVFLGFYTRPEARALTGWRADARGWAARRPDSAAARPSPSHGIDLRDSMRLLP